MDSKTTTFGLSSKKLARLLNIGSDIIEAKGNRKQKEIKNELLHEWLTATLPIDAVVIESLPNILQRLYKRLQPHLGESFRDLLKNPKTDVMVIKKIKGYSKKLVASAKSEAEHDAATTIYFAAIASALVHHDQRITTFSYQNLNESFSKLINDEWVTDDIAELFRKASEICRQKINGNS